MTEHEHSMEILEEDPKRNSCDTKSMGGGTKIAVSVI